MTQTPCVLTLASVHPTWNTRPGNLGAYARGRRRCARVQVLQNQLRKLDFWELGNGFPTMQSLWWDASASLRRCQKAHSQQLSSCFVALHSEQTDALGSGLRC